MGILGNPIEFIKKVLKLASAQIDALRNKALKLDVADEPAPQVVENFSNIVILMIPWIIGGSIVGGYLGYHVYRRVTPSV